MIAAALWHARSMFLVLRATFAVAATALVVWLLRSGMPLGAVLVVCLGVAARRRVEFRRARAV